MEQEEYGYKCKTQIFSLSNKTEILLFDDVYKFYVVFDDGTTTGYAEQYLSFYKNEHKTGYIVVTRVDGSIIYSDERENISKKLVVHEYINKKDKSCYVSPSGSDSNDGTYENPFASIQNGINEGFGTIILKSGTYVESVSIKNIDTLNILTLNPYDSANVYIDATGHDYGFLIDSSANITIKNVTVMNSEKAIIKAMNVTDLNCVNVIVTGNNHGRLENSGFELFNVNGVFTCCRAIDIDCDGFNMHGYGNTVFNDCVAYGCSDDGISHHDNCTGVINGGEYSNCGKAGIAPTYGANVNISNCYSHNNTQYGLLMMSVDTNVQSMVASNCLFKNNGVDISVTRDSLTMWNTIYDTKDVTQAGTFVEY